MDMGILNAAFMLAPLAMHKVINGASMRCLLLGHTNGSVLAVNKTITNSKDLNGKTIGIPHSKSTHRVLLYKYFKDRGMEKNINIKLVKTPPPLTITSLKSGKIDGYCVAEPWGSQGLKAGIADILESSHNIIPNHACCIVMVKNRTIDKHMNGISEWVKSLINAGKFIHAHPKQAGLMQKPFMNQVPEDIVQAIKKEFISYVNIKPDKEKLDIIGRLSLECGLLHEKYNFTQLVDNRFA
jgi:NitT/TauT family transport system substrate-binding protein